MSEVKEKVAAEYEKPAVNAVDARFDSDNLCCMSGHCVDCLFCFCSLQNIGVIEESEGRKQEAI